MILSHKQKIYIANNCLLQNNYLQLLPLICYILHTKLPFLQKLIPYPHIFSLKILPMERFSDKVKKKIIEQILGYISFRFEIQAHLGHLYAYTPKIIELNRWSSSKNEPNTKLNHIFTVYIIFCARNPIKDKIKNVNKSSLFCSIFVIFLIFWPLALRK